MKAICSLTLSTVITVISVIATVSPARAANTFTPTGDMGTSRYSHTATLLPDGTVLVAGGAGGNSTAERYDPATGKFTATGAMQAGHEGHTATLLATGEVLIAGGATTLAERYHPTTGEFTTTGAMNESRSRFTATLLHDGTVLITGGHNGMTYLATAERYYPTTGQFSTTGNLAAARGDHCATLLPNGTVLITGGGNDSSSLATAEVYDPVTGQFSSAGALLAARSGHTALLLPSGKVLVAGGYDGTTYLGSSELYDPVTGMSTTSGVLTAARSDHKGVVLPNGMILVTGGRAGTTYLATAELYDPCSGKWSAVANIMLAGRNRHAVTILANGRVLIAGGFNGLALAGAEIYDATTGYFTAAGTATEGRNFPKATLLPNGNVLILSGYGLEPTPSTTTEIYDPSTGTYTSSGSMGLGRVHPALTLLPSGKVLVAGGGWGTATFPYVDFTATAELYDSVSGTWSPTGAMKDSRGAPGYALLPNGKVLVAGGICPGVRFTYCSSAELYDPVTETWSATGTMSVGRFRPTVTVLTNGKVLITGGRGGNPGVSAPYIASAELYDPATGQFTSTGSMTIARGYHTATLLPNGKVLVVGGSTDPETVLTFLTSAEIYDPATGLFTPTGSMATGRVYHKATLLPNGKVLVVGGGYYTAIPNADLYDPATGTWENVGNLVVPRHSATATLLTNGQVLIVGGSGTRDSYTDPTSELYDTGLGFAEFRRPVINSVTVDSAVQISGKILNGGTEGSGSFPLVSLQRLDNEQIFHAVVDPVFSWSGTAVTSALPPDLPYSHYLLTATANGVPSVSQILALPPPLVLSPSPLEFGTVSLNGTPNTATATVTLSNPGSSIITVVSTGVTGPGFTLGGGTCGSPPFTLAAAGGFCDMSVTFVPTVAQSYSGHLNITDASGRTTGCVLSGQGTLRTSTLTIVIQGPGAAWAAITGTVSGVGSPMTVNVSSTAVHSVPSGSTASLTSNNIFSSWSGCDSTNNASCTISMTTDKTVTATFPPAVPCSVTFNSNGGSAVVSQTVIAGSTVTKPADPTKNHATFTGWYSDAGLTTPFVFTTPITTSAVLHAKWTPFTYTVTFNSNGGSPVAGQIISYNGTVTRPADPIRTVYPFLGWYTDSSLTTAFDFATPIIGNITLYAKWARDNIALQVNGGTATASSFQSSATASFAPAAVNNGDRKGLNYGKDGLWFDNTSGVWPDWVQVTFNGLKMIDEIDVFTVQDAYLAPVEPTAGMIFTKYGITVFEVQYWNGTAWQTVPGGSITGNNLIWRKFTFSPVTTDRIRVTVTGAVDTRSRITEIEAYGTASPSFMPVRIGSTYYSTLRAAYLAATDGAVIEPQAVPYDEALTLDVNIAVTVKGGFDAGFTTQTGFSGVRGITIGSGRLIADRLSIL